MKKIWALSLVVLLLASCGKNELEPVEGYNTVLAINNIQMNGLDGFAAVRCVVTREFIIATDTTAVTDLYNDTLDVIQNNYNTALHFNTPEKATSCNINIKLIIYGGNIASSTSIGSVTYSRNNEVLLEKSPVEMSGSNTDEFSSGIFSVPL